HRCRRRRSLHPCYRRTRRAKARAKTRRARARTCSIRAGVRDAAVARAGITGRTGALGAAALTVDEDDVRDLVRLLEPRERPGRALESELDRLRHHSA